MSYIPYSELKRLIDEYKEDSRVLRDDRIVIQNYPKVFTMSAASMFERNIKKKCEKFISNPKLPINPNYPNIMVMYKKSKPIEDQMFAKLQGYDNNGIPCLSAKDFYDLFGGTTFKSSLQNNFSTEKTNYLSRIVQQMSSLEPLCDQDDQFLEHYIELDDLKVNLQNCNFVDAEESYLNIKLRRNRVAHDYINGLSDTFSDIRKFYEMALIYVVALENTIDSLAVP